LAAAVVGIATVSLIARSSDPEAKPKPRAQVLVFSKTAGFRHDSIPAGIAAIRGLGRANGFSVSATENANAFTPRRLRGLAAVVFLNTTGDVLGPSQQRAFKRYVRRGGGWVGIHSAADTEYGWPFYGRLLGAYFKQHPAIQQATIDVGDRSHPSTRHLPAQWTRTDEWYDFRSNPRGAVHVLATLDESTYSGGTMGADHPIAWCHRFKGGRAFYTAGGHTIGSYSEPEFRRHLLGGILWAAGLAKGGCRV
jgi:type 1 glutamine amidotransferase